MLGVRIPVSCRRPVVVTGIPAGINPPYIGDQTASPVGVNGSFLIFFGHAAEFRQTVDHPRVQDQLGGERRAVFARQNVCEVEGAPQIAGAILPAGVCLVGHTRGADGLARLEVGGKCRLSCPERNGISGAKHVHPPCACPADSHIDTPIAEAQPHIGEGAFAGSSVAVGLNCQRSAVLRHGIKPCVAVLAAGVSVAVRQHGGLPAVRCGDVPVRQDRGVIAAPVGDVHDPVHDREVKEGLADGAQFQPLGRVRGNRCFVQIGIHPPRFGNRMKFGGEAAVVPVAQRVFHRDRGGVCIRMEGNQPFHVLFRAFHDCVLSVFQ